jgi:hypothetical protein
MLLPFQHTPDFLLNLTVMPFQRSMGGFIQPVLLRVTTQPLLESSGCNRRLEALAQSTAMIHQRYGYLAIPIGQITSDLLD